MVYINNDEEDKRIVREFSPSSYRKKEKDKILAELIFRYPVLESCRSQIIMAEEIMEDSLEKGGTIFILGNGGSAADAAHITGELLKGFVKKRPISFELKELLRQESESEGAMLGEKLQSGLRAIDLNSHVILSTAVTNDLGPDLAPAQMLMALGRKNDVFLGISTSGNARNVELAGCVAGALDIHTIGLSGGKGGKLAKNSEVCIMVPENETYKVQELHLPVYHALCMMLEARFF